MELIPAGESNKAASNTNADKTLANSSMSAHDNNSPKEPTNNLTKDPTKDPINDSTTSDIASLQPIGLSLPEKRGYTMLALENEHSEVLEACPGFPLLLRTVLAFVTDPNGEIYGEMQIPLNSELHIDEDCVYRFDVVLYLFHSEGHTTSVAKADNFKYLGQV